MAMGHASRPMTTTDRIDAALQAVVDWGEVGVQIAAYLNGRLLVDAWTGVADTKTGRLVDGDTLFCPFSVTKVITATALNIQAERGLIDYDAPVAMYWPEFAVNGKEETTVRHLLTHRGGIPQLPDNITPERMADWGWMVRGFERMEPMFPPGEENSYHGISWGWPIGELVHRTDPEGRSFALFAKEEVLDPLGMYDTFLGLPDCEFSRYAPLENWVGHPVPDTHPVRGKAIATAVALEPWIHNQPIVLKSVHPSAGCTTSARSMARIWAMLAGRGEFHGVRLLSPERVESFLVPREHDSDLDHTVEFSMSISSCGYWLTGSSGSAEGELAGVAAHRKVVGEGTGTIYQPGAGGSYGWADLDTGLAVMLCHNRTTNEFSEHDSPFYLLADAIREEAAERG
jgi:CubicO group peptidase (beta-lactamase class C family)